MMKTSLNFQKILYNCQWDQLSRVNNIISPSVIASQNIISASINDDLILVYFPSGIQKNNDTNEKNDIINLHNLTPNNRYSTYAYNSAFDFFQELGTLCVSLNGELEISSISFFRDLLLILKKV